jgi:predicted dehydrogenase
MDNEQKNRRTIPRVAVIGCGNIGSLHDEENPAKEYTLTHAGTYYKLQPKVKIVALCDPEIERLNQAGKVWKVKNLYTDFHELLGTENIDILSICTPTFLRLEILKEAVQQDIKHIICEKPIAATLEEAEEMLSICKKNNITVSLNYLRRWDPEISKIKEKLNKFGFGEIQVVTAYYGKGILNNGSHLIDLMNYYFGTPTAVRVNGKVEDNFKKEDPTLACSLDYKYGLASFTFHMIPTDHNLFTIFELDIVGTKGRVKLIDKGLKMEVYEVGKDEIFQGYKNLFLKESFTDLCLDSFKNMIEEMLELFHSGEGSPRCTLEDGVVLLKTTSSLLDKSEV